jgi:UvrD/REP helicase N-terminal domain
MKSIDLISAGAGSGKTTRLATLLAERIASGVGEERVRPEGVIAVTFTVKAAAELARRVREELLKKGKVEEAHRLGASRIGTVNAVCGRLLSDFAFDLGLSPDLTVLDEESAEAELARSLSSVVTREEEDELEELGSRLPELEWNRLPPRIACTAGFPSCSSGRSGRRNPRSISRSRSLRASTGWTSWTVSSCWRSSETPTIHAPASASVRRTCSWRSKRRPCRGASTSCRGSTSAAYSGT